MHPLSMLVQPAEWKAAQYTDGDFVVHFAGIKGEAKQNLMVHFLAKSRSAKRNRLSPKTALTIDTLEFITEQR